MKKSIRAVCLTMGLAMLLSACGNPTPSPVANSPQPSQEAKAGETTSPEANKSTYPLTNAAKIRWWLPMHANYANTVTNFSELAFAKELGKRVGVEIEYIQPPMGQEKDNFNIMIASGDIPDIIEYSMKEYLGGATAAMEDKVIMPLNEVLEKYAPNFNTFLKENPEIAKQVKTDEGKYYCFPNLRIAPVLKSTSGPMFRADWLNELNLEVPETIEEWENALTLFKDKKGATAAFSSQVTNGVPTYLIDIFYSAYGGRRDFYVDNGVIKYGQIEPMYKDYLTLIADWYKKGLIDPNFLSTDRKSLDANMVNGLTGAAYGPGGGAMSPWILAGQKQTPGFDLVAAKYPVLKKGSVNSYAGGIYDYAEAIKGHASISATSKNVEVAARVLDYGYSDEGYMLYNFGVEGETYKMVEGKPVYTELITKNPNGLTFAQALSFYSKVNMAGPFVQDSEYIFQFYEMPQQKNALIQWSDNDGRSTMLPPVTLTPEESAIVAKYKADIDTYEKEMYAKFVTGKEPVENFDKYVAQIKGMKIDELIKIYQDAYNRYIKR